MLGVLLFHLVDGLLDRRVIVRHSADGEGAVDVVGGDASSRYERAENEIDGLSVRLAQSVDLRRHLGHFGKVGDHFLDGCMLFRFRPC